MQRNFQMANREPRFNKFGEDISHCVDDKGNFIGKDAYYELKRKKNKHRSLLEPITIIKAKRVLAYLEDKMSRLQSKEPNKHGHPPKIACIDYVGSALGTSFSEPEHLLEHSIKSQIGITQWVIEALESGQTITDFRAFYEKRCAKHHEEVFGTPHPYWKK